MRPRLDSVSGGRYYLGHGVACFRFRLHLALPAIPRRTPAVRPWLGGTSRRAAGVRLLTRRGNDWTQRYPLIAAPVDALRVRSCLIDGEAVAYGDDGLPAFDRLRYRRADASVFLYAFDLLELDGRDLRREPLEVRKATLASVLRKAAPGVQLNEHLEHDDGQVVFRHAASSDSKASCPSARDRPQADHPIGSR